jgi:cyclophilin family peptidyl-prolyl cis-trans isomerase/predicted small lipoprotein YifL
VRRLILLLALLTLAGCGGKSSANSSPPATIAPTATPTAVPVPGGRFKSYPPMTINKNHRYTATVVTTKGTITIQLLPKLAPLAVNSFVFLARKHYFDGQFFHRIVQDFVIQTGDPTGTGYGGPGYTFKDELHPHMRYIIGTVAMANTGPNTNGSQFFIVTGAQGEALDKTPNYTIFGEVISGLNAVLKIAGVPVTTDPATGQPDQPLVKVHIKHVYVHVLG